LLIETKIFMPNKFHYITTQTHSLLLIEAKNVILFNEGTKIVCDLNYENPLFFDKSYSFLSSTKDLTEDILRTIIPFDTENNGYKNYSETFSNTHVLSDVKDSFKTLLDKYNLKSDYLILIENETN